VLKTDYPFFQSNVISAGEMSVWRFDRSLLKMSRK